MLSSTIPVLPSLDLDETSAFYELLGFRVAARYDGDYLIIERGGHEMHFFLHGSLEPKASFHGCYWRVGDAQALYEEYARLELDALHPIEPKPWGMLEFALLDPHGNLIRIGEEFEEAS